MANFLEALGDTLLTGNVLAGRARAERRQLEQEEQERQMQNLQAAILGMQQKAGEDQLLERQANRVLSAGPNAMISAPDAAIAEKAGYGARLTPAAPPRTEIHSVTGEDVTVQPPERRILPTAQEAAALEQAALERQMFGYQLDDAAQNSAQKAKQASFRQFIETPDFDAQPYDKKQKIWTQAGMSGQVPDDKHTRDLMLYQNNLDMQKIGTQIQGQKDVAGIRANSQNFAHTLRLRDRYMKETKAIREMQRQFGLMQQGLKSARDGDLNAGSQAILVTFQKILDPDSVVRESEYARSPQGLSLLSRIEGAKNRLIKGGPGVPLEDLETFVRLGEEFVANASAQAEQIKDLTFRTAVQYELDPSLIFESAPGSTPQQGRIPTNPPPGAATPPAGGKKFTIIPQ